MCPEPLAEASKLTLSPLMQQCIDALEEDYAVCGLSKQKADQRFVECARAGCTFAASSGWRRCTCRWAALIAPARPVWACAARQAGLSPPALPR